MCRQPACPRRPPSPLSASGGRSRRWRETCAIPAACRPAPPPARSAAPPRPAPATSGKHPPPQDPQRKYDRSTSTRPSRVRKDFDALRCRAIGLPQPPHSGAGSVPSSRSSSSLSAALDPVPSEPAVMRAHQRRMHRRLALRQSLKIRNRVRMPVFVSPVVPRHLPRSLPNAP